MAGIQEYLDLIKNAIYGRDVRQAIHDGILQCYLDARGYHYQELDSKVEILKNNKVNQPLDVNNKPTNGTSGQSLRTKGDGTTEWASVGLPTDEQTEEAINAWLDDHPEATTTVEDESLTYKKLVVGTLGFVMPQMFGAKGDGTTDDLTAFNDALSSGKKVFIPQASYYLSDYVFTDDSVIIEDNGNYPNKKLIVSQKIKDESISVTYDKVVQISLPSILDNGRSMQASCYDSTNNRIVIAYVADNLTSTLLAYDKSYENLILENEVNAISHFNDLTYNPITHKIYTPARPTEDTIYVIDPDTLNVETSFTIDFGGIIKRFSYDSDNDIYFASGDDYICVYDSSFNKVDSFNIDFDFDDQEFETGVPTANIVRQSSLVVNGQFIMLWNEIDGELWKNVWLTQFDYANKKTKKNIVFNSVTGFDEAESIYAIDDVLYILSSQGQKNHLCSFPLKSIDQVHTISDAETDIESGTNMNDLIRYGVYVCRSNVIASSLVNCPTNNAFRLYVLKSTSGVYLIQIFVTALGDVYLRYFRNDNKTWHRGIQFYTPADYTSNITASNNVSINYIYKSVNGNVVTYGGRFNVRGDQSSKASGTVLLSGFDKPQPNINGIVSFICHDNNKTDASAVHFCYLTQNGELKNATPIATNADLRFTFSYMLTNG